MKKTLKNIALFSVMIALGCKQDVLNLTTPETITDTSCADAQAGTANFTKFIAVGTSWTAGFQAGALFTAGQDNSLAAILNKDFTCVGASATFVQPSINSTLGYNIFVSPNPGADNLVRGRFLLQGASPKPTPQPYALGDLSGVPNPLANHDFIYAGDRTKIQNFSVEAITLGQFLIPNTGNFNDPNPAHGFSPFYARFASDGGQGGTTLITDAATALATGGTFFLFWPGMDDYMLYAANGGDSTLAPLTKASDFAARYPGALGGFLSANNTAKGVVGNLPDIFKFPHFTSVPYNPVPLDEDHASTLMAGFTGYNTVLQALIGNPNLPAALKTELATRGVSYTASASNNVLIVDEYLTDLTPYFDQLLAGHFITQDQRDNLAPYVQVRQTTSADILPLSAGSVIGTQVGDNASLVNGVSYPLADKYVITPTERDKIIAARTAFNETISTSIAAYGDRIALADVDGGLKGLAMAGADIKNGVLLTFNINPPTGIFSEDGLHPNTRGYAYVSNIFVNAINAKFGSTVPLTNVALYGATALPIP